MYYTGIDLHKKTSFITTIDARGKIVTRANLQNAGYQCILVLSGF
jgi:hypothetical protein